MRSGAILQFPVQNNIMMAHYERGGSVVDSLTLSLLRATAGVHYESSETRTKNSFQIKTRC